MRLFFLLTLCASAYGQTTANLPSAKELDVTSRDWADTGIDLRAGDAIIISATGELKLPQNKTTGPGGASRGFRDLIKAYPVNQAGLGALIARIGSSDASVPFLVGANRRTDIPRA